MNSLDFNSLKQTLIASGGPSGELYIFNLADPRKPTVHQPGTSAQSPSTGAITSVAFHPGHSNILASSAQNGTTVIWDLRKKLPAFSFSDPNRAFHCKAIAWNPDQPMHIAAASDDDEAPLVNIWDLHMTIEPKSTLRGHRRGVMAMSWCQKDKSLLLSSGKDNRTLCWDIISSSVVSEIGSSSNWNLDVQWALKDPTTLSTCSLDGKVRVYSLSDFDNLATPHSMQIANSKISSTSTPHGISEDDLFNRDNKSGSLSSSSSAMNAASDLVKNSRLLANGAQVPPRPPAWLRRPAGASFAFGGKLVSFGSTSRQVSIQHLSSNQQLSSRAAALQEALQSGSLESFCQSKLDNIPSDQAEERQTWTFLKSLCNNASPKQEVLAIIDHDPEAMSSIINEYLRTLPTPPGMLDDAAHAPKVEEEEKPQVASPATPSGVENGLSDDLFEGSGDEDAFGGFSISPQPMAAASKSETSSSVAPSAPKKLTTPISLQSKSRTEDMLTKALIIGDFEAAVECCVRIGKMAEALVIASCGGEKLFKQTQNILFRQNSEQSYINVIVALANKDLENFVERVELKYWRELLAILCVHAREEEFKHLCTLLGDRLSKQKGASAAATLCFLCSGAVDHVTASWLQDLHTQTSRVADPAHRQLLIQDLMEKVVIFNTVSKTDASKTDDLVLQQYSRYAELLANQGLFEVALRYLSRLNIAGAQQMQHQSAGVVATAQLLDRVYNALPPQVAQSCYGGYLQPIYGASIMRSSAASHASTKATPSAKSNPQTASRTPALHNQFTPGPPHMQHGAGHVANGLSNGHSAANGGFKPPMPVSSGANRPVSTFTPVSTFQPATPNTFQPAAPTSFHPGAQTNQNSFQPQTFQPQPATPHYSTPGAGGHPKTVQQYHVQPTGAVQFKPITPGTFTPVGVPALHSNGAGTFMPAPAAANPVHVATPAAAPPKKGAARVPVFSPSAAPVAAPVADPSTAETAEVPKKKKLKKSASKKSAAGAPPSASATGAPAPTPSARPATGVALPSLLNPSAQPLQPQGPTTIAAHTPFIQGPQIGNFGPSSVGSPVALPPPTARVTKVPTPHMRSAPAPAPSAGGPARSNTFQPPAPVSSFRPPGPAANPSTWDPQSPLPPHLLNAAAGVGAPPPMTQHGFQPQGGFQPVAAPGFAPTHAPAHNAHGFQPQPGHFAAGQQQQLPGQHQNFATPAPASPSLPPPKPGRAKKDPSASSTVVAPTPVYVTGPQAEALAAPKEHEPTQQELDLLASLVAVLDKIGATGDAAHADLVSRFEDLKTRLVAGQIPSAIVPTLVELAAAMTEARYLDAQEKHGEVTGSPHYHAIGSKAMLGLKRMIILIQRYNL